MGLLILLGLFAVLVAIGVPVAFALGIGALASFGFEQIPFSIAFQRMIAGVWSFPLLAVPFFIFAGELMLHGGIAARLVNLASSAVGWMRGGLGQVNVFSSMLFGGISGSAVADVSALGSLLIPVMKEKGYSDDYAVNVTVTSSIAGIMIPPSHNMILYAVAAGGGVSISALFMAGIVPGAIMALCLAVAARIVAIKKGFPTEKFAGVSAIFAATIVALPALFTAVIIVGGSVSGVFTVTESGAIGVIYIVVIATLVYRSLSLRDFWTAVTRAVRTTAMVMILVASARAFGHMLTLFQVPELLTNLIFLVSENPIVVLLLLNLTLLLLGMIMDMAALILITTPIFLPVAVSLGMDPVQFGMILMMNLGLGLCTPPVGACLFVGCAIGDVPIERAVKTIWPFYLAILVALMLTTFVPAISMTLPRLVGV